MTEFKMTQDLTLSPLTISSDGREIILTLQIKDNLGTFSLKISLSVN